MDQTSLEFLYPLPSYLTVNFKQTNLCDMSSGLTESDLHSKHQKHVSVSVEEFEGLLNRDSNLYNDEIILDKRENNCATSLNEKSIPINSTLYDTTFCVSNKKQIKLKENCVQEIRGNCFKYDIEATKRRSKVLASTNSNANNGSSKTIIKSFSANERELFYFQPQLSFDEEDNPLDKLLKYRTGLYKHCPPFQNYSLPRTKRYSFSDSLSRQSFM